jgi:hypothetical protein
LKIPTLVSLLSFAAAINIFYAVYALTQDQILNTLVFTVTFLVLIYAVAILDADYTDQTAGTIPR